MGVINASPESFFKGSVQTSEKNIACLAERMQNEGADLIDVGAMSSAPYLITHISLSEECRRLKKAVQAIRKGCSLPISIDTFRLEPAQEGLDAGAEILNDITGLQSDPRLGQLARHARGLILMAHPSAMGPKGKKTPVQSVKTILEKAYCTARKMGVPAQRIVLDPGIGFFRHTRLPWWKWDLHVLKNLRSLTSLGPPLLVGVSRKSFIGHILGGKGPEERLNGSLAATTIAVLNGASVIRTHDVRATREILMLTESILKID